MVTLHDQRGVYSLPDAMILPTDFIRFSQALGQKTVNTFPLRLGRTNVHLQQLCTGTMVEQTQF